jgi:PAS domain S-box-containing protein
MIWGYSPDDVENDINLVWDRTRAGGDYEQVRQSIVDAIATGTRWLARYRAVLPDGTVQTHLGSGTPTFHADGTVIFNSFVLDITKEVRQEQLLYQATEMAQIGSWEINLMNQSVTWSPIVYRLHETESTSYIPDLESIFTFYRDDFRDLARTFFMKCIQTGQAFDFEAILITATAKERWVRVIGHAEQFGGQIKRIHGSIQDIHTQNVTKEQLKNTIKKLQDYQFALDKSASFTVTDTHGVITDVNDHFCTLSQFSREELIGQTHHLINSHYHTKEFFSDFWTTIQSGSIWRGEVRNQKKDGTFYWVDTTVVPFLNSQNKPFQYLALRIDITAKKLAEEKILKSYEKLKKIAWTESHVVRAPLARMLSIIQLIEARDQEEDIQVWFDHLKSSSLELDDIVTKIVKEAHVIED